MKNKAKENLKERKNKNKSESDLVTKESFSAALMLFSVLAFLMLCTKSLIFGAVGTAVHVFLVGTFGYFAYPLFLGATYLFCMMLIGKRLVKNRKAGVALAVAIVLFGLLVHAILTSSWGLKGYIAKCFEVGANFPASTVCGLVGGLIIYALFSFMSKVGTIILLSALFALSVFFFVIFIRKKKNKPENNDKIDKDDQNGGKTVKERKFFKKKEKISY